MSESPAETDQPLESPPAGTTDRRRWRRIDWRRTEPGLALVWLAGLLLLIFVAVRLGPALLGFKSFTSADMLGPRAPWWNGGPVARIFNDNLGDTIDSFAPTYVQMHLRLFSGDIPWWSSLSGPGTDLLALPNSPTLTPSSFVMLLWPTWWASGLAKLLQVLIAVAGMALWLRRTGAVWAAGLFAGLVYLGTGFFAGWSDWAAQASVAALIPALFWLIERHVQLRTLRSALPISLIVAFLLLGGFPATAGHALYAGAAYFVVRLVADRGSFTIKNSLQTLGWGVGGVILGFGLSAIQFLPQISTVLGTNLDYRSNQFNIVQPLKSLLTTVVPRALNPTGFARSNVIEAYGFVGIGTLFVGALAVCAPRSTRVAKGLTTFLVVGLALSAALVWKHGWWTDWMASLPIFSGNNSSRLRDMFGLFASALAGVGMNLVMISDLPARVRRRLSVAGVLGLIGAAALLLLIWRRYGSSVDRGTFVADAVLGLAGAALVLVALVLARRRWLAGISLAVVLVLTVVQTGNSVTAFWPLSPTQDFFPDNPVISAAQTQSAGQRAVTVGTFIGSTASPYNIRTVTGHTFQPSVWTSLLTKIDPKAYQGAGRTVTNPTLSLNLSDGTLVNPLLDRLAANTVIVAAGTAIPGPGRLPDGTAADQPPAAGPQTLLLASDRSATLPIAAGAVRAVQIYNRQDLPGGSTGVQMVASITDGTGAVRATGSVRRPAIHPGWIEIPVAGEQLSAATGPLTLAVKAISGSGGPTALALAATGAVPTVRLVGSTADGVQLTFAGDQGTIWKRPSALPRIRWATATRVVADPAQRLTALADPALPSGTVLLSAAGPAPSGAPATLTTVNDAGDDITVDVNATGAGYLVVADWMQSDWEVSVDGQRAALVDADYAFNAVFVPAGNHRVSFGFTGGVLTKAMLLTAGSLVVLIALYVFVRIRDRRRVALSSGPVAAAR